MSDLFSGLKENKELLQNFVRESMGASADGTGSSNPGGQMVSNRKIKKYLKEAAVPEKLDRVHEGMVRYFERAMVREFSAPCWEG